jgi:hypothetical protein
MTEVTIDERFRGPADSANGGYVCGILAATLDAPLVEVTLRLPPPLGRPLRIATKGEGAELRDGEDLVASAEPLEGLEMAVPSPPGLEAAEQARSSSPLHQRHPFPECFVCGPARERGDGLGITAGPVSGRDLVASPWEVGEWVEAEGGRASEVMMWAALDCPSGIAPMQLAEEHRPMVLGRLAARVLSRPRIGDTCEAIGWVVGSEGRKNFTGSAIFSASGGLHGYARATWIELRPA